MPMARAQIAAGIVARFTPHVGGCWKMLDRRVRVESRFLCVRLSSSYTITLRKKKRWTHPHCMTTKVKKYTLCAS